MYRDYIKNENIACEILRNSGFRPQGYDYKKKKVVVMRIKNENTNNETRAIHYFKNWMEAKKELVKQSI